MSYVLNPGDGHDVSTFESPREAMLAFDDAFAKGFHFAALYSYGAGTFRRFDGGNWYPVEKYTLQIKVINAVRDLPKPFPSRTRMRPVLPATEAPMPASCPRHGLTGEQHCDELERRLLEASQRRAVTDRVDEVKAWAHSRIRQCREEEADAGPIALEARAERVALETVLRTLDPGWLERVDKRTAGLASGGTDG